MDGLAMGFGAPSGVPHHASNSGMTPSSLGSLSSGGLSMYHFEDTLGRGNFSVVKLATHVISQTKVAVKIIDKTRLVSDSETLIAREIDILRRVKHPNIIGLFQIINAANAYYIINEYVDGGDLFETISKDGRLGEMKCKSLFYQLVNAVNYLHSNNICHRDIKAENVLLVSNPTRKTCLSTPILSNMASRLQSVPPASRSLAVSPSTGSILGARKHEPVGLTSSKSTPGNISLAEAYSDESDNNSGMDVPWYFGDIVKLCDFGFSCDTVPIKAPVAIPRLTSVGSSNTTSSLSSAYFSFASTSNENSSTQSSQQNLAQTYIFPSGTKLLSTWCGSPPYAAPELFKGEPYIGSKVDVWSLGVLLYAMLCGILPFSSQSYHALKKQVLEASFNMPFFVSPDAVNLINKILVLQPEKRYTTSDILNSVWFRNLHSDLQKSNAKTPSSLTPHRHQQSISPTTYYASVNQATKHYHNALERGFSDLIVDPEILEKVEIELGVERDDIVASIMHQKFDMCHAMYLYTLEKYEKDSQRSAEHSFKMASRTTSGDLLLKVNDSLEFVAGKPPRRASFCADLTTGLAPGKETTKLASYLARKRASLTNAGHAVNMAKRLSSNASDASLENFQGSSTCGGPSKTVYIGRLNRRRASDITSLTTFQQKLLANSHEKSGVVKQQQQFQNIADPEQSLAQTPQFGIGRDESFGAQSMLGREDSFTRFFPHTPLGTSPGIHPTGFLQTTSPIGSAPSSTGTSFVLGSSGNSHLNLFGQLANSGPSNSDLVSRFRQHQIGHGFGPTVEDEADYLEQIPSARRCSISINENIEPSIEECEVEHTDS